MVLMIAWTFSTMRRGSISEMMFDCWVLRRAFKLLVSATTVFPVQPSDRTYTRVGSLA